MDRLGSSPAARAFFAALDESHNVLPDAVHHGPSEDDSDPSSSSAKRRWIQKRIQTLGWRNRYSQTEQYPVQMNNGFDFTVRQVQRGEIEGTYGTGATVWPASIVLVKYLQHLEEQQKQPPTLSPCCVRGRRILELGGGTGVATSAAALLGASYCVCTDGEDSVVQLARDNIRQTALQWDKHVGHDNTLDITTTAAPATAIGDCPVAVQKYWWGTDSDKLLQEHGPFDVILVSDCVLPKLYPIAPLVQALDELLPPQQSRQEGASAVALLSYEHRYYPDYHPKDKFVELCQARNLQVETIGPEQHHPVYSTDDIELWRVYRQ